MVSGKPALSGCLVRLALAAAITCGLSVGTVCGAEPALVAVNLFEAHPSTARIFVEGPCQVTANGLPPGLPAGLHQVVAEKGQVTVKAVASRGRGASWRARKIILSGSLRAGLSLRHHAGMLARHYRGQIELTVKPDGMLCVRNILPVRDYVVAVVGSETNPDWPPEAIKAQAVLTQTRMFRYRPGDELGDTTQQEAYLGCDYERPPVKAAVERVWGQILAYDHRAMQPFYHSTCAGRTSAGDEMFGLKAKPFVYLVSRECPYCKPSPFCKTTANRVARRDLERIFGRGLPAVSTVDVAGRPQEIILGDGRHMRGYDFWIKLGGKLGWDKVPGTRFKMVPAEGDGVEFQSTGAGHGVGMCQWGAAGLARQGKTYREILDYYFPGTQIQ